MASTSPAEALTSIVSPAPSSALPPMSSHFARFASALEAHHERRERLIKVCRDIIALSKNAIFALQRMPLQPCPPSETPNKAKADVDTYLLAIRKLLLGIRVDLRSEDKWRYHRQTSGAVQELVEALSFRSWVCEGRLIGLDEVREWVGDAAVQGVKRDLTGEEKESILLGNGVVVTEEDYILGLFDLTGELMRWCLTHLSPPSLLPGSSSMMGTPLARQLGDLKSLAAALSSIDLDKSSLSRKEWEGKMKVMQSSVEKVEWAAYGMMIRGRERPAGWKPEAFDSGSEEFAAT